MSFKAAIELGKVNALKQEEEERKFVIYNIVGPIIKYCLKKLEELKYKEVDGVYEIDISACLPEKSRGRLNSQMSTIRKELTSELRKNGAKFEDLSCEMEDYIVENIKCVKFTLLEGSQTDNYVQVIYENDDTCGSQIIYE